MNSGWMCRFKVNPLAPAVCLSLGLLAASPALAQGGGGGGGTAGGGAAGGTTSGTTGGSSAGTTSGTGAAQRGGMPPGGGAAPGGGGGGAAGIDGGSAGQGNTGQAGQGQEPGQARAGSTPRERIELQREQRSAAPSSERARDQLQDLNELSRQLAPSNPVPAPDVGGRGGANR